mmetsp:Transcript_5673/g.11943  ORF Transcript_5673/g.11943 Transcript_5673/m.11943 type:complete len:297 (+) Transcript_5673:265-1155(+)|eukprot:CAMPEP_0185857394 /NCGR_PEP_ID=MMETSP1354-20130828/29480_1 /TAXON_ID=708628 /ORGANISM="Erythrolobus madagascarensis, Strain CCMP3276" /LENGTH=296 /DNA_ID=CAMNT_0028559665 /DNA_START=219 /DNA_END=1109 /DNA_ORIENTATION=+
MAATVGGRQMDASTELMSKSQLLSADDNHSRIQFYHDLHNFMAATGNPIQRLPTLGFKELDLWVLYNEVVKRRGIDAVIAKKQWKEVADALDLPASCTDSGFRLRLHYIKYLEAFERAHFVPPPEIPQNLSSSLLGKRSGSSSSVVSNVQVVSSQKNSPPASGLTPLLANNFNNGSFDSAVTAAKRSRSEGSSLTPPGGKLQQTGSSFSPVSSFAGEDLDAGEYFLEESGDSLSSFSRLEASTLRKYRRVHKLPLLRANPSKEELASSVAQHFRTCEVQDESEALLEFIDALERRG